MQKTVFSLRAPSFLNLVFLLTGLFILYSCAVSSVGASGSYKPVPYGKIVTGGVEIAAEDGSFVLRSGKVWTPPFQNAPLGPVNASNENMINLYKIALASGGAKKVMVKVPYQPDPLYGVLLLSSVYRESSSAVTRSYQISIPKSYVDAAQNGKVSVLYEYYDMGGVAVGGMIGPKRGAAPKTWVLWLSDIPFSN